MALTYGPDTDEMLRRMNTIENNTLILNDLAIHSLPDLPAGLQRLYCYNTELTSLPELPAGLQRIN